MTIDEAREHLSAYLDGELDETTRRSVEDALGAEPELRAELDALRRTVGLVRSLPRQAAPPGFAARVTAVVAETSRPARRAVWRPALLAAAAVLLVGLATVLVLSRTGGPRPAAFEAPAEHGKTRKAAVQPPVTSAPAGEAEEEAHPAIEARKAETADLARTLAEEKNAGAPAAQPTPPPRPVVEPPAPAPGEAAPTRLMGKQAEAQAQEMRLTGAAQAAPPEKPALVREDLLKAIRDEAQRRKEEAPAPAEQPAPAAETRVVDKQYDDLRQCLAQVRSALETSRATYVLQPIGSGQFVVDATLARDDAAALLARLGAEQEPAQKGKAGAGGPPPALERQPAGPEAGGQSLVHLVLRFRPRGPLPAAQP